MAWLVALPLANCHVNLAPAKYRDVLAVCYMYDPTDLPSKCGGCGATLHCNMHLSVRLVGLLSRDTMRSETVLARFQHRLSDNQLSERQLHKWVTGLWLDLGVQQPQV